MPPPRNFRAELEDILSGIVDASKQAMALMAALSPEANKLDQDHMSTLFGRLLDAEIAIMRFRKEGERTR